MDRRIQPVLNAVSATMTGEANWPDVGAALRLMTGAGTISLWVGDPLQGHVEVLNSSFDASIERQYSTYYCHFDEWTHRATRLHGSAFRGTDVVSERKLRKLEFYADFGRPAGMFHLLGAVVPLGGGAGSVALGMHRPESSHHFDDEAKCLLDTILPHLRLSLRVRYEMGAIRRAAQVGLDNLTVPVIALNANAGIIVANTAGDALLKARRGLKSRNGCCVAANPGEEKTFAEALARVAAGQQAAFVRLRQADCQANLSVMITKSAHPEKGVSAMLYVLGNKPSVFGSKAPVLQAIFGLTPAEAEVATAVARGDTAAFIATRRNTSVLTVRAQLRQILAKTEAGNLRALASLIALLPISSS